MSSKYTCPHCGSENTMSVPMAYKSGHVTGYATGREIVGYTDVKVKVTVHSDGSTSKKTSGGDAIYGDVTRPTESYSDLARTIQPPAAPRWYQEEHETALMGCGLIGCALPLLFTAIIIVGLILEFLDILPKNTMSSISRQLDYFAYFLLACVIYFLVKKRISVNKENAMRRERYEKEVSLYRQQYLEWEHTYICLRCGCQFIVED